MTILEVALTLMPPASQDRAFTLQVGTAWR
jgi:hypothetical protein